MNADQVNRFSISAVVSSPSAARLNRPGFSVERLTTSPRPVAQISGCVNIIINLGRHDGQEPGFTYVSSANRLSEGKAIILRMGEELPEVLWDTRDQVINFCIRDDYASKVLEAPLSVQLTIDIEDPFIVSIATAFNELLTTNNTEEYVYSESLMVALILHVGRQYSVAGKEAAPPKGKLRALQLKEVIDFSRSTMHNNAGLDELASVVHLSAYHFGRLFKQTTGLSPYQFVLQQKIEYAKRLMKQRTGPIGEIAYQLNFSDQAHFSNAFRKATGLSPREFIRQAS